MQDLWARLESWLGTHYPDVLQDLNPPATEQEISDLQGLVGLELPKDFADSLRVHNGQQDNYRSLVPFGILLSVADITQNWTVWKDLLDSGDFEECGSEPVEGVSDSWWNHAWIPFTYDGGGNHECIDLAPASGGRVGQVITMWHDMPERELVAGSFREWFEHLVLALESGNISYSLEEQGWQYRDDADGA